MMRQLTAMVSRMGDVGGAAEAASQLPPAEGDGGDLRPIARAVGHNVSDLVEVLCGPTNASTFLKFGGEASAPVKSEETQENGGEGGTAMEETEVDAGKAKEVDAGAEAGGLATLLVSCAYSLPLQTPSVSALTLGVESRAPPGDARGLRGEVRGARVEDAGRDLDMALECAAASDESKAGSAPAGRTGPVGASPTGRGYRNGGQVDAYYRSKLLLRYLAQLAAWAS
ncbi:hypothetical protein THAOC_30253 [Thalassiosira oceanica]|uniref:Uncharacterized protein n=1 Tax=Thalassiosira oceanica TaxID=159749 RepID=K0RC05_THAOC|nr:hypothetical protein THAOC_30253 [Thalassiosira oceanica]|eukprot:EJK50705.1 hypothetical protein THAOC_30253 [Thalassiosira oceanica]